MMHSTENNNEKTSLEKVFSITHLDLLSDEKLISELAAEINNLILINFERLVQLLYRIDVSEVKLKTLLKENPNEDAGRIIASLIIERQFQKLTLKSQMKSTNEKSASDEERW